MKTRPVVPVLSDTFGIRDIYRNYGPAKLIDESTDNKEAMAKDKEDVNIQKQTALRRLFEDDWMLIHVDTRVAGVAVPENLKNTLSVTFKLSRLFQGVTEITDTQVTAQLLFGTTRQACIFPYDAVWGATSFKGSNLVWPESAPQEVLAQLEKSPAPLAAVSEEPLPASGEKRVKKKSAPARGHLRRVK